MKVFLKLGAEIRNGWQSVWMTDECGRHLHTEPVCTIPVGYGQQWFADYLNGRELDAPTFPLMTPCPEHSETNGEIEHVQARETELDGKSGKEIAVETRQDRKQ